MKALLISFIIALGSIGIAHATTITEIERLQIEMVQVATAHAKTPVMPKFEAVGVASWYDYSLNGIVWSKNHRTAASRTFPRYSTVRVTNLANGKSVEVFINDYGPEECPEDNPTDPLRCPPREIDLSSYAFSQIADLKLGLINIKAELIK